jgi:hypothetical protein
VIGDWKAHGALRWFNEQLDQLFAVWVSPRGRGFVSHDGGVPRTKLEIVIEIERTLKQMVDEILDRPA